MMLTDLAGGYRGNGRSCGAATTLGAAEFQVRLWPERTPGSPKPPAPSFLEPREEVHFAVFPFCWLCLVQVSAPRSPLSTAHPGLVSSGHGGTQPTSTCIRVGLPLLQYKLHRTWDCSVLHRGHRKLQPCWHTAGAPFVWASFSLWSADSHGRALNNSTVSIQTSRCRSILQCRQ